MYSSLIHWFERHRSHMACPSRQGTVRIEQTRRANAGSTQTMRNLCVNSSCQFVSMWTLIGTHSCTRLELFVNNDEQVVNNAVASQFVSQKWHDLPRQNRGQKSCKCQTSISFIPWVVVHNSSDFSSKFRRHFIL